MTFKLALHMTEVMMALAFLQQSAEHVFKGPIFARPFFAGNFLSLEGKERTYFGLRIVLSGMLLAGFYVPFICLALVVLSGFILYRFDGPYNGGADRMSLLILLSVTLAHWLPAVYAELALGYLGMQLVLSYFISGYVKIINPAWRSGQALVGVFDYSAYPVSQSLRGWAIRPRLLIAASWVVMVFELAFPMLMVSQATLVIALVLAAAFHIANACLFGLNRFFWIWLCAYPSIIWLQDRVFNSL